MADQQRSNKGNPAHKRMSNVNLKARRARSWAKRQLEKKANIADAAERKAANDVYRAQGLPTPYESRQAERRVRYLAR